MREAIRKAERVIIKLGTRVLTHDDGRLALSRLFSIVEVASDCQRSGREVIIVSSGAVGLGRDGITVRGI